MLEALAIAAYMYTVKPGDTLYAIAPKHDWVPVCQENHLANCNLIYPGEKLRVGGWSHTVSVTLRDGDGDNDSDDTGQSGSVRLSEPRRAASGSGSVSLGGTLGCAGLERLWDAAGGNPGAAFIAAEIAMAESGGNQYAISPTNDYGYWQINGSHGALATLDAFGNARAAIAISGNGTDWSAWTTYQTGAYIGRCLHAIGVPHICCIGSGSGPNTVAHTVL